MSTVVDIHKHRYNEFFMLKNEFAKEIVVFNENGKLIVSECINIQAVNVIQTESCTKHFAINFLLKNISRKGYLTQDCVIRSDTTINDCKEHLYL